jgi:hypothetical protein
MIAPFFILRHFYAIAPFAGLDDFANEITPTTAAIDDDGNIVLTVASPAAFKIGNSYTVRGKMANPFTSTTFFDGFKITTSRPHNLTTPAKPNDAKTCDIGAGCEIVRVYSDTEVEVKGDVSGGILYEPIQTEGVNCKCLSVDGNLVTLEASIGYVYESTIVDCRVIVSQNIITVPTAERALENYTEQTNGKPFVYLIMGDRTTAAKAGSQAGIIANGRNSNPETYQVGTLFDLIVFWPKKQNENNRFQMEEAYGRIYEQLNRVFFGANSGGLDVQITPVSSVYVEAQSDYVHYAQKYSFQAIDFIQSDVDGIKDDWIYFNEAIRTVNFDLFVDTSFEAETQQKMQANINTNEE